MRVLVLSDIHANLVALETVLAHAGTVDVVWCLGDTVGYGARANECLARLQELGAVGILGNHDAAAAGLASTVQFNTTARLAAEWTAERLTEASRAYLEALPLTLRRGHFQLVHGSVSAPLWQYISSVSAASANLALQETPHCLTGHTHVPTVFTERRLIFRAVQETRLRGDAVAVSFGRNRSVANPGSVGQPRDGDPRASYMLLDDETGLGTVHRVAYDVEATQRDILQAGLPRRNADRLSGGR